MPFVVAFDTVWAAGSIVFSFVRLLLMSVKVLIIGPFMLVAQIAPLNVGSAVPAAMEGTSLTLKWWRAWQEFWTTVVSPIKNLAKAWLDSVSHVMLSASRREASIRRWYAPKFAFVVSLVAELTDLAVANVRIAVGLLGPGCGKQVVLFASTVYLYWLLLVVSPSLLAEVCVVTTGAGKELVRWQWSLLVQTDVDSASSVAANSLQREVVEGYLGSARAAWEQLLTPVYDAVTAPVHVWRVLRLRTARQLHRLSASAHRLHRPRLPLLLPPWRGAHREGSNETAQDDVCVEEAVEGAMVVVERCGRTPTADATTESGRCATASACAVGSTAPDLHGEVEASPPISFVPLHIFNSEDVVDYGLLGRTLEEEALYRIGRRSPGTTALIGLELGFDAASTQLYDTAMALDEESVSDDAWTWETAEE